jgi:hypothetical protein
METAISITSLAIAGLTAIGSIVAYYKCKSCKWFCFECDCFPAGEPQSVVINNDNRQESPNVFHRHESPNIINRHESPIIIVHHESPVSWRHESPNISALQATSNGHNELTHYFERGRKAKPDYDVSVI